MQKPFEGFYSETLAFLKDLASNNNKPWFDAHRYRYERFVLNPLRALVVELTEFILTIDPDIETAPAVNKTISRIYRDTRFSKDKTPFRSNMWIVFKRPRSDWKDGPGYFFELFPDWYRYGMGFYSATPATMARFREMIDDNPDEFLKVTAFYEESGHFELNGEKYKRLIDSSHPPKIHAWVQMKNFYIAHNSKIDDRLFSPSLVDELISHFIKLVPLYHYIERVRSTK